jgi:hypothetical protein
VAIVGGTLVSPTWATSTATAGASANYTYTFTTNSTSTLNTVTMSVPSGTTVTPTVGTVTPASVATGGAVTLSGTMLTYTFTGATIAAGTAVSIQLVGLSNTPTAGTYTSNLASMNGATTIDTGTTPGVTILPAPESLNFTNTCGVSPSRCMVTSNGATAITLIAIPGAATATTATVVLSVSTNAAKGYRVRAQATTLTSTGGSTLAQASTAGSASQPVNQFFANATLSGSGSSGASLCTPYGSATPYVGYSASSTAQSIWNATASTGTGTDVVTIVNGVRVTTTQAAGTYTGTIGYTVNPVYTGSPSVC